MIASARKVPATMRSEYGRTRRDHRQSLGADRLAPSRKRPAWRTMERASQSRKRHPLEATYRTTVEGFALHGGPWQTCYDYFVRWRRDGTWDRLLAHVQTKADAVGEVEWEVRAWTTRSCGLTSTLREHAQRRATKTQKGAWPPLRGSARKKPWRLFHQGPSRL